METSKQGFVSTPAPGSTVSAQGEDRMLGAQATLPAMYLQSLGGLPRYPPVAHQGQPTGQEALALPLSISPLHTKQALPLLTFHIASGMHLQQGQRSVVAVPPTRPKSTGKHVCPHCGRDCLKPSVLEKHLRCHTGERPYPCTICGIAFKTQSNLYKHKRTQAHARLSSESEKVSFSSQESISGTGDASSSSPCLRARSEDLESFESEVIAPPVTLSTTSSSAQPPAALGKIGSDTGWALHQAALVGLILAPVNGSQEKLSSVVQKAEPPVGLETAPAAKPLKVDGEQKSPAAPKTLNRHLLLQRQEATSFSKQWESSTSGRKSQSYDSTDSGFSESNEHHWTPSPTSTVHDQSMESLTESSVEHQEGLGLLESSTEMAADAAAAGPKSGVSVLEKKKLEERISKLISENETLVDDKRLENVRPRKTVLSKQGSIDLPMPYTYKDSFHFEIKTTKQMSIASSPQSPDMKGKQALYNSVPTQQSNSLDHTPLTRSSSLPFSLCTSGLQRRSQHGQFQKEGVQMGRRDSSGQLYISEFAMKSVDQQSSHHRSLVRQSAVDCLPAGEGLNATSSMEENYPCSLGSDGDSVDASGESIGGKCRRKKSQKFSYSKWHMYGGGTFTKLYSTEKGSDHGSLRAKKAAVSMEQGKVHEIQSRTTASLPETVSSVASTADLGTATTSIQSTFHSQHLPSPCDSQIAHGHSNHFSSEPDLRKPSMSDLSTSTNQSVVRQYSPLTPDCLNGTKAGLVKGNILREQSMQHNITSQCLNHLPSERKKQRTGDGAGMPVDIKNLGEKEHNVLSCMTCKIGSKRPNQSSLALCNSTIPTCTHLTKKADGNKLLVQQMDNKMDLSLSFISHRQHQRSRQTKEHDSFASLMTLGGVSASPSVSSPPSRPAALTKASFLPKYQLKLPHSSVSGQGLPDMPALQQRLAAIPASEQSLTVISTSEQGITVTSELEESHPAVPAIDSEQSCTPTPLPTTQKSYPPLPTPMAEHRLPPMPTQSTEKNHVPVPASTLEQSHSPIATRTLRLSTTPMPTPTSAQSHTPIASPTPEMSSILSPNSSSELSHPPKPTPTLEHSYFPKATREKSHTPIHAPTLEHILPSVPTPTAAKSHTPIPASPLRQSHPLMCTPSLKQSLISIPTHTLVQSHTLLPKPISLMSCTPILTSSLQPSYTSMVTSTLEQSQSQIPTTEKSCTPLPASILGQRHPPIPPRGDSCSPSPASILEQSHPNIPTPEKSFTLLTASTLEQTNPNVPTPEKSFTPLPASILEQTNPNVPTPEKSFTPLPASILEQSHSPIPSLGKSCTPLPASILGQTNPTIPTPEKSCTPSPALISGQSHPALLTPDRSCTPSPAFILGQGQPPIPTYTLRQSNSSLPIASVEWSHTSAPTVTPKSNNTCLSTSAINWSLSSTPNPQLTQLTTAASTTSEVCAATHTTALNSTAPPITGQIHPASPTIISGQSRNSEANPATEALGQMYSVSLQHSATATATPMPSDAASSSPVCSNQDTHLPTLELLPAGQVILLKDASNAGSEETEHLKPGDIQIFLQIISDSQLSLMESQLTGNVQQQMNISQDVPVLSNDVQGCSTSGTTYTNSPHQASSSQSPGPSTPSYCEIFTQAEQHQEYQSSDRAAQKSFTPLKSIPTPNQDPAAHTDVSRSDRTALVPGQNTGGSVLRTTAAQLACVHTEPQMHNHGRPAYCGLSATARNFECPNQKLFQEVSCSSVGGCQKESLPLQRMRADGTHSPVLLYSQAPPSSMDTSTATVERSTYPRLCIPDLCSTLEDTSTKTDKHTVTGTEEKGSLTFPSVAGLQPQMPPVGIQMNTVNAAAAPIDNIQSTDPLNTESLKNKMLSADKHHQSPAPSSLHVWDDARCPDGLFSSDSMHCQNATPLSAPSRMERPTSAEPVGGDTSSTSHLSSTSNRLFIHPSSEAVRPTTHSDLSAPTSTSERPSMFQGSVTPSSTVRRWTLDIAKESHQEDLGGGSLPSDLSQQGTVTTTHPSLEGPVQTCLLNVTQELLQQVTPEHTSGCVPPEPIAQQQTLYEGHALQASECDRSVDPRLQVSHIAPKNSQQEPVSASPPGQYKLCLAASISLSPSASTEISSGSVQVHVSIQHKPFNQTESCNTGKQGAESGISTTEIIANPGETSGRFSTVEPAQLTQVGDVEQSGLGTSGQSTEVSSPSSCQDRKAPLSQDLIVGTDPSIGLTKIEKTQLSLEPSNLLCGLVTGPLEKAPSGDALNISPLQSCQMQVTSHQVTHQGLEHAASKANMATGQEGMGSDSFASSPQHAPEESQTDNTQASDAGHLCFSSSPAQQEVRTLGSRQRLEGWEDRETEELGCRWQKKKETGEKEATDSGVMENTGFTSPSTSPSAEPHKGPASEEVVMDGLDDNGSLTNAGSTVLPHSSSHRNTTRTLQFHALKETNILHVVQTATRRETCTLQMLQSLTQNEASATHAGPAHRDGQYCSTGQNQLRHYSDVRTCSSDWGMYRGLCPPLSPAQQGHPTEACPLPVVTSQLGSKTVHQAVCHNISWGTSTPPLQPVGSGVQREAVDEATQTTAKSTAEPSEQPTPASTFSVPSQSSVMSCSPSMSMRSAEVSTRAPPNSLEEADTSSSDDEGRLVIELE